MEEQQEIQRLFRQQQEKYVYYIVALSITAIGFSIYKTTGQGLNWIQIPLAISVLCWGFSIFCGLKFIKYTISNLYANNVYFDLLKGRDPEIGNQQWKIEAATSGIKKAMVSNIEKAKSLFKWQERLFYAGTIMFIVWHILEMYQI